VVSITFNREVREPYKDKNGRQRYHTSYQGWEFVFPHEYSKLFRPIFDGDYGFEAKEENGVIIVTFTPDPPKAEDKRVPPKSKTQASGGEIHG
jgi:hypothetical protein